MPLRVLGSRVLVLPDPRTDRTRGGIYLPGRSAEQAETGLVLDAGDGRRRSNGTRAPWDFVRGDRVMFPQHRGETLEIDGARVLCLEGAEILAVLS